MTNREFFNNVINNTITEEVKAHAKTELVKLDEKNEKRKNTLNKNQKENELLKVDVLNFIKEKGASVASAIGVGLGMSTQKASSLCTLLVKEGKLSVSDLKVKNKGTVKQYTLIEEEVEG